MYLIEDDKCIYNDNIICEKPNCEKCQEFVDKYFKKEVKKLNKLSIEEQYQTSLFDIIDNGRKEYAKRNKTN